MKEDIQDYAISIFKAINSAMKIKKTDLCFCWSGKIYIKCCEKKDNSSIIFTKKGFKELLKYKKAIWEYIKKIPPWLFKEFEKKSLSRFCCLYPNCHNKPILSHSIPKNILKKNFGTYCLEIQQDDDNNSNFIRTPISKAWTLPLFCETHDNNLFLLIEKLEIDFNNKEHLFLLSFKSISFSYRTIQYLLWIDSQIEIFRPILFLENSSQISKGSNITLEIPKHTIDQYSRFKITNNIFKESIKILQNKKYGSFIYFNCSFDYDKKIFFSSFINPLFDLTGKSINDDKTPINMTINIFTKDKKIYILLWCPPQSKKIYSTLFNQLAKAETKNLIDFLNNIIESSPNKPFLAEDFKSWDMFIEYPKWT
jgi:hypothetical protein